MAKKKTQKKPEARIVTLQVEIIAPSYVPKRRVARLVGRCIENGIEDAVDCADEGDFNDPDIRDAVDLQLLRSTLSRKPKP